MARTIDRSDCTDMGNTFAKTAAKRDENGRASAGLRRVIFGGPHTTQVSRADTVQNGTRLALLHGFIAVGSRREAFARLL